MIKLLLLFLLKSKRFYSVIVGDRCGMGGVGGEGAMMFFRGIALLFKPIDTQTPFGIKKYSNSPVVTRVFAF